MNNNNFVVSVPKELKKIQSKLFFGLTKRQLIGFGSAIAIGLVVFFLFKSLTNIDVAMYALFIAVAPIFFITIYTKDGMPAEKWIKLILEYKYLNPLKRTFKVNKFNINLAKERGMNFGKKKRKRIAKAQPNASVSTDNRQKETKVEIDTRNTELQKNAR